MERGGAVASPDGLPRHERVGGLVEAQPGRAVDQALRVVEQQRRRACEGVGGGRPDRAVPGVEPAQPARRVDGERRGGERRDGRMRQRRTRGRGAMAARELLGWARRRRRHMLALSAAANRAARTRGDCSSSPPLVWIGNQWWAGATDRPGDRGER